MTKKKLVSIIAGVTFLALCGIAPYFIVPTLVIAVIFSIGLILYGFLDNFDEPGDETSYYLCIPQHSLIGPVLAGNLINLYAPARAYSITSSLLFLVLICSTAISPVADSSGTFKRQEFITLKFVRVIRLVLVVIFLSFLATDIYDLVSSTKF